MPAVRASRNVENRLALCVYVRRCRRKSPDFLAGSLTIGTRVDSRRSAEMPCPVDDIVKPTASTRRRAHHPSSDMPAQNICRSGAAVVDAVYLALACSPSPSSRLMVVPRQVKNASQPCAAPAFFLTSGKLVLGKPYLLPHATASTGVNMPRFGIGADRRAKIRKASKTGLDVAH